MNSAAFGVFAAILIVGALVASFGRSLRLAISGLALAAAVTVVLFAAENALLLALATLIIFAASGLALFREVGKKRAHLVNIESRTRWSLFAALPLICGVAVCIVVLAATGWHQGNSSASLITIFHYRYPIVGVVVLAAVMVALTSARVNVTLQHDEKTHHQLRADKAAQAERMARRRADREAAKQRRRERRSSE
jgi:uncharacterized membrane protein